jgi:two-component system response regulator AtoC
MATFLIVDDEETFSKNAAKFLEKGGHTVRTAATGGAGISAFTECSPDAVVLDFRLPDIDGLTVIARIRALDAAVPILMITGHGSIELAVEAMKAGANDLLTKPVALGDLRQRLVQLAQRQLEATRLQYYETRERGTGGLGAIVGDSAVMHELRERIARIADVDVKGAVPPVLIIGETGTGKELVARACHFGSARRDRPFIEINCAAIPANLLESELFGHERGAFTDAKERKHGLIEAADGGTLFLDEIGEMDVGMQAKLLKVIEDGKLRRVGSLQERKVDVCVLAATNQDLEERIRQGAFRADLYFRLAVLKIRVPALRDRDGDALVLARHFLAEFARRYRKPGIRFDSTAEAALAAHAWPGNVRELRNVVEQAVLLAGADVIAAGALMLPQPALPAAAPTAPPGVATATTASAADPADGGSTLDRVEREMLLQALAVSGGNVSKAARELGVSRDTLRYRMDKHGLGNGRSG